MARERRKREPPEIPVSSFSDIAFLLIIFFILATTIERIVGFVGELPSGQRSETPMEKAPSVQLHGERLMMDEKDVDLLTLRKRLFDLKLRERQEEQKVVMMETTGKVNYQRYYEVMAAISAAGGVVAIVKDEKGK